MTCRACGYSDMKEPSSDPLDEVSGLLRNRYGVVVNGDKPFIAILPGNHTFWVSGGFATLYACPVCGTVKMEVPN